MRILISAEALPGRAYHPKANASQAPKPAASCFLVGPGKEGEDSVLCPLAFGQRLGCGMDIPGKSSPFPVHVSPGVGARGLRGPSTDPSVCLCPPLGQRVTLPWGLLSTVQQRWPGTSRRSWGSWWECSRGRAGTEVVPARPHSPFSRFVFGLPGSFVCLWLPHF